MLLSQPPAGSLSGLIYGGGIGGNPAPPGSASPGAPAPQGMSDVGNGISIGQADNSFGRSLNSLAGKIGIGLLGAVPGAQPFAIGLKALSALTAPPVQNLNTVTIPTDDYNSIAGALSGNAVGPGTGDISGAVGGSVGGAASSPAGGVTGTAADHAAEAAGAPGGVSSAGDAPGGPGPGDNGGDNGSGGGDNARGGIIRKVRGNAPAGSQDDGWITAQRGEAVLDRGATQALGPRTIGRLNSGDKATADQITKRLGAKDRK